ncbi:ABC transporter permease [Flagellimonas meridianipacifica]|uniref:ABC-type antimicrobial peptide transport system permease subunit n=1 Tax=Flagellimonas meridianipacifica TaxID=1080225 RepID=A0A2T0MGZ6_9FLAO|nr:ABC transporter permease [Allomuricauda pacifica]PRX56832.1 ABC-type antimicrobial peptide transport system permease subunit [Allomuricauda pacifica]
MLKSYFKIAWRNLIKRKVFTTINILGLSIGFGSAILIYLFLGYHYSFDDFHPNEDLIYRMATEEHTDVVVYSASVPPAFAKVFREEYAYTDKVAKIVGQSGLVLDIEQNGNTNKFKRDVLFTEEDFFKIFNFPLLDGSNAVSLSAPNTAVITQNEAIQLFGHTDVVGKTFVLENDKIIEITGVLKNIPQTSFLEGSIFIAFKNLEDFSDFAYGENWGGITTNLQCFALLKPNQDIAQIENVLLELPKKHRPNSMNTHVYKMQPLSEIHLNHDYGGLDPVFLIVFGIIGLFLLVIASINFINISTAQAFYRSKEIGIRKVLGGFKKQLFWQFLSETFLISLFAIALGFGMAILFLPSFNALFEIQLTLESLLSFQFFGFLIALLILVSLLSGAYPGLLLSKIVPILALKGKLSHNDTGGATTRKFLVVAQFVISISLIVATLVISRQIKYATQSDLGFDKESIVMLEIPETIDSEKFYDLKERLKQVAGVQKVSGCLTSPGGANTFWDTTVKYNNRPEREEFSISIKIGDEDYLNAFNIPLAAGRNFFKNDSITEMLVNEKFVEKVGADSAEDILGRAIAVNGERIKATIVGVVKNFHDGSFTEEIKPVFIAPYVRWYNELGIKINHLNTKATMEQLEKEWSQTFSKQIFDYRFLDESVAEQYETEQRYLSLSKVFSGLAIFIGCLGLYGLILFFVSHRTKEIGIRKVLGSSIGNILTLLSTDFLKLIAIAGIVATPASWYIMDQWLQGYTYRTEIGWWVFALAIGSVMLITLLTISYQTLKAASANPIKSLRTE